MTDLLDIIQHKTGKSYKKVASTGGGEIKGPCPWCDGEDRFSIQPAQDFYICRQCKKSGDAIQFCRDFLSMGYYEACTYLNRQPDFKGQKIYDQKIQREEWSPRKVNRPDKTWQQKAEAIAFQAFKNLMSAAGKSHRDFLHARGIDIKTIKAARIGYNPNPLTFDMETWGLEPEMNKFTGKTKNIWIPAGLVIPYFLPETKQLVRIRVRQDDPKPDQARYILVTGSSAEYMRFSQTREAEINTAFLVEAEIDGWLCHQEFGDLSEVAAIGNTTARPDTETDKILSKMKHIALSLDNDDPGIAEGNWWKRQYGGRVMIKPVDAGKDPSEAVQDHGLDLRTWFLKEVGRDPAKKENEKPKQQQAAAPSRHQVGTKSAPSAPVRPKPTGLGKEYETLWNQAWALADYIDNPDGESLAARQAKIPEIQAMIVRMANIEQAAFDKSDFKKTA